MSTSTERKLVEYIHSEIVTTACRLDNRTAIMYTLVHHIQKHT